MELCLKKWLLSPGIWSPRCDKSCYGLIILGTNFPLPFPLFEKSWRGVHEVNQNNDWHAAETSAMENKWKYFLGNIVKSSDSLSVHSALQKGILGLGEIKSGRCFCCHSDNSLLITVNNCSTDQLIRCYCRGSNLPLLPCTLNSLKTSEQKQSSVSMFLIVHQGRNLFCFKIRSSYTLSMKMRQAFSGEFVGQVHYD